MTSEIDWKCIQVNTNTSGVTKTYLEHGKFPMTAFEPLDQFTRRIGVKYIGSDYLILSGIDDLTMFVWTKSLENDSEIREKLSAVGFEESYRHAEPCYEVECSRRGKNE